MEAEEWDETTDPRQDDWHDIIPPLNLQSVGFFFAQLAQTLCFSVSASFKYERAPRAYLTMIDSEQIVERLMFLPQSPQHCSLSWYVDQCIIDLLFSNRELFGIPE